MWWRVALERFQEERREGFSHVPLPQMLPLPGMMATRPERHPAQTWAAFFTEIEQSRAGPGENSVER